jgi:hypothetical protein
MVSIETTPRVGISTTIPVGLPSIDAAFALAEVRFGLVEVGSMKSPCGFGYNGPMEYDDRDAYTGKLAERGLEIHSFDGNTLRLNYNPAADSRIEDGQGSDGNELAQYARKSLDELPEAGNMFPGLDEIVVDFSSL